MKLTKAFIEEIHELIRLARATVARGVDVVQVHTNFEIGRRIVEQEQQGEGRAAYGKEVIKALAARLTNEFGGGFSERNLAYMRTFYLTYRERIPTLQTTSAKSKPGSKSLPLASQQKGTATRAANQNQWLMRRLYGDYRDRPKLQPLVREINGAPQPRSHRRTPALMGSGRGGGDE